MALIPPDTERCQAERPNSVTFMSLGGRREMKRCGRPPALIVTERAASEDGEVGSMSLCIPCLCVLSRQEPLLWAASYVTPLPEKA
jgi:hypothetical protein